MSPEELRDFQVALSKGEPVALTAESYEYLFSTLLSQHNVTCSEMARQGFLDRRTLSHYVNNNQAPGIAKFIRIMRHWGYTVKIEKTHAPE